MLQPSPRMTYLQMQHPFLKHWVVFKALCNTQLAAEQG